MNVTAITNVFGALRTVFKGWEKWTRRGENRWTSRKRLDYCIVQIGQNTEMSPGDMKRLTVTQIPVKDHQLTLV